MRLSCRIQSGHDWKRDISIHAWKHTSESHSTDQTVRGFTLLQKEAVQSADDVRWNLHLVEKKRGDEVYISPSKKRSVQREVAKVCREVLSEFTSGEHIDRTEGSLKKIYIQTLVDEHNRPDGMHVELHQQAPTLCYQFSKGIAYANFVTPFLKCPVVESGTHCRFWMAAADGIWCDWQHYQHTIWSRGNHDQLFAFASHRRADQATSIARRTGTAKKEEGTTWSRDDEEVSALTVTTPRNFRSSYTRKKQHLKGKISQCSAHLTGKHRAAPVIFA